MIAPHEAPATTPVPDVRDDPLGHVLAAPADYVVPRVLLEAVTQNVLRALLSGFLHEPPLAHWYRNAFTLGGNPLAYHAILERLLPRLNGTSLEERAMFACPPRAQQLGEWVSSFYRLCQRLLSPADSPELETPTSQISLGCRLPSAVRRLADEMRGHTGLQLYLHGSLATCDATTYSDVDTLLIVSHGWLESGERANELRRIVSGSQRWLYCFDPLQHHGFMVATELDLGRYARCYFPLELLSYAYALSEAKPVRYRVRASDDENHSLLRRFCDRLDRLERREVPWPSTRFALKLALSEMMLLPTYFLQATKRVMYKRESFAAVRQELSPRARDAMDLLSSWRREWRLGSWELGYRAIGAWAPPAVGRRVLARARAAGLDDRDRARWESVLPAARLMGAELLRRAEASA